VLWLSGVFFPLAFTSVGLGVAEVFARMGIQRRWRAWLTDNVVSRWLNNGRYYQLNLVAGDHKNPEYRIAEDLRIATDAPVDFVAGVTSAVLSAATFIAVLWTIGGALTISHGRGDWLCRPRQHRDGDDRPEVRCDFGNAEPGRS
jgi:putative ATP-binding cassette transporter